MISRILQEELDCFSLRDCGEVKVDVGKVTAPLFTPNGSYLYTVQCKVGERPVMTKTETEATSWKEYVEDGDTWNASLHHGPVTNPSQVSIAMFFLWNEFANITAL